MAGEAGYDPFEHIVDREPTDGERARAEELVRRWEEKGLLRRVALSDVKVLRMPEDWAETRERLAERPRTEFYDDLARASLTRLIDR